MRQQPGQAYISAVRIRRDKAISYFIIIHYRYSYKRQTKISRPANQDHKIGGQKNGFYDVLFHCKRKKYYW